jgi:hypothetical protein
MSVGEVRASIAANLWVSGKWVVLVLPLATNHKFRYHSLLPNAAPHCQLRVTVASSGGAPLGGRESTPQSPVAVQAQASKHCC